MSISSGASTRLVSQTTIQKRLHIDRLLTEKTISENQVSLGIDVIKGLSQKPKILQPKYFYDDKGSQLFEQICQLPEYYLTRTETAILQKYAQDIAKLTGTCEIVELGSGSSTKTRILLDAYDRLGYPLRYLPIDVSAGILESSARELLIDYPSLEIHALASTYELALKRLPPAQLSSRMLCFIGSTLGNLHPQECNDFLSQIKQAMQIGEYFLLGIDLQKPKEVLEAAYNDTQGVTAAFNVNMLDHLNHKFQGDFDTTQFEHWAFYNESEHQVEMHLRSLKSQTVELKKLNLTVEFEAEETIHTEISRKFNIKTIQQQLESKGLAPVQVWTDSQKWFALLLCQLQ